MIIFHACNYRFQKACKRFTQSSSKYIHFCGIQFDWIPSLEIVLCDVSKSPFYFFSFVMRTKWGSIGGTNKAAKSISIENKCYWFDDIPLTTHQLCTCSFSVSFMLGRFNQLNFYVSQMRQNTIKSQKCVIKKHNYRLYKKNRFRM